MKVTSNEAHSIHIYTYIYLRIKFTDQIDANRSYILKFIKIFILNNCHIRYAILILDS